MTGAESVGKPEEPNRHSCSVSPAALSTSHTMPHAYGMCTCLARISRRYGARTREPFMTSAKQQRVSVTACASLSPCDHGKGGANQCTDRVNAEHTVSKTERTAMAAMQQPGRRKYAPCCRRCMLHAEYSSGSLRISLAYRNANWKYSSYSLILQNWSTTRHTLSTEPRKKASQLILHVSCTLKPADVN